MSKTNPEVSVNQIDKIIKSQSSKYPKDNKTVVLFDVAYGEQISINVTPILSIEDMNEFAEVVSNSVFIDDEYAPALFKLVRARAIMTYYTDLKTNITNDKLLQIIYNTDIIERVEDSINPKQFSAIETAIGKAIEFKKQSILSEQRKLVTELTNNVQIEQNDVITKMNSVVELFEKISNGLDGYGKKQLAEDINMIANKDEKEIVDNILEFRQNEFVQEETASEDK